MKRRFELLDALRQLPNDAVQGVRDYLARREETRRLETELAMARAYRNLARQIITDFADKPSGARVALCSAGSPVLAAEAVVLLARYLNDESGAEVLLIDGASDAANLAHRLQGESRHGLLDVLINPVLPVAMAIGPTEDEGVSLVALGEVAAEHITHELLRKLPNLMDQLSARYPYVLVHLSSIFDDRRCRYLVKGADLSLVLAPEGDVSTEEVARYRQAMSEDNGAPARVILCCAD